MGIGVQDEEVWHPNSGLTIGRLPSPNSSPTPSELDYGISQEGGQWIMLANGSSGLWKMTSPSSPSPSGSAAVSQQGGPSQQGGQENKGKKQKATSFVCVGPLR